MLPLVMQDNDIGRHLSSIFRLLRFQLSFCLLVVFRGVDTMLTDLSECGNKFSQRAYLIVVHEVGEWYNMEQ